jgi:5-(carboxyamino)imidazole ribonucleotide synthase
MANLLGDLWLAQGTSSGNKLNFATIDQYKELASLIIYGKTEARPGRKMGHLITQAARADEALSSAMAIRDQLKKLSAIK